MIKKAIFLWLIATPAMASYSGYNYRRTLTTDPTQVSTGTSSFANWIQLDSSTVDPSHLFSAGKFDVIYTSASDCTQSSINWDTATVNGEAWYGPITISSTTPVITYKCYGNTLINSYQGNKTSVYSSDVRQVIHFSSTTAAFPQNVSFLDSTAFKSDASSAPAVAAVDLTPGQIYGGARTTNGSTGGLSWIIAGSTANSTLNGGPFTWSFWAYSEKAGNQTVAGQAINTWGRFVNYNTFAANSFSLVLQNEFALVSSSGILNANQMITWIYTGSNTILCVNVQCTSSTAHTPYGGNDVSENVVYGASTNDANTPTTRYDEVFLSTSAYTADWVFTRFNSINSPTFITIGAETQTNPPTFSAQLNGSLKFRGKGSIR